MLLLCAAILRVSQHSGRPTSTTVLTLSPIAMIVAQFPLPTIEIQLPPRYYIEGRRVSEMEFCSQTPRPSDSVGLSLIDTYYEPSPLDLK